MHCAASSALTTPYHPCEHTQPTHTHTGGILLLQDLLLLNVSLTSPTAGNPSTALLPAALGRLPPGALLKLRNVVLSMSAGSLRAYAVFLQGAAGATLFTDNTTFLHLRNFSSAPFGAVEALSLTLVAPAAAAVNGRPLAPLLTAWGSGAAGTSSEDGSAGSAEELARRCAALGSARGAVQAAAAAVCADAAGVPTVTDSYVLGASNATLLPALQRLGGGVAAAGDGDGAASSAASSVASFAAPLLVLLASNVTLAPRAWGAAWPARGLVLRRPVGWVGSSQRPTSLDFGMHVGQVGPVVGLPVAVCALAPTLASHRCKCGVLPTAPTFKPSCCCRTPDTHTP